MDALSSVLRSVKLDSAIFFNAEFSEPWRIWSPPAAEMREALAPAAEHVVIYHLLCAGRAYVEIPHGGVIELEEGDLITFPQGDGHWLGAGGRPRTGETELDLPDVVNRRLPLWRAGGGGPTSRFICGFLACDRLGRDLMVGLPRFIKVTVRDDRTGRWLEESLRMTVAEIVDDRPGAEAMLAKLSELAFAETLRRYVRQQPDVRSGWLSAVCDPQLSRALDLLHRRPAFAWTAAALAREAGLSRTLLSMRFRQILKESPMAYLARWRLQLAARALVTSSEPVAQIAAAVGYESEAAFNRAFKRLHGVPPARYRRDHQRDRRAAEGA